MAVYALVINQDKWSKNFDDMWHCFCGPPIGTQVDSRRRKPSDRCSAAACGKNLDVIPSKVLLPVGRSGLHIIHSSLGPQVHTQMASAISSTVFAWLSHGRYKQSYSLYTPVCNNRPQPPHLASAAMWRKIRLTAPYMALSVSLAVFDPRVGCTILCELFNAVPASVLPLSRLWHQAYPILVPAFSSGSRRCSFYDILLETWIPFPHNVHKVCQYSSFDWLGFLHLTWNKIE